MLEQHIKQLQGFYLQNLYYLFKGQLYMQVEGVTKGSPVSSIVANLYIENFESRSLRTTETLLRLWKYVADTFVMQKIEHKENFLQHINFIDQAIKFTVETCGQMA